MNRSPRELGLRALLLVIIAILAVQSFRFSLAQVVVKGDQNLAHRLAPGDARIAAALAAEMSGPRATLPDRTQADELARSALRRDPTAVAAVAALGLNAQVRGETKRAREFFVYAQKLSRRNLITQLWSIEDAVSRDDIPGALRWYDATLRTTRRMDEVLFPILVRASEDRAIQRELVRTLQRSPIWGEGFIKYAAGNGPYPLVTVRLFQRLRQAGVSLPESAKIGVIDALARKRFYREAWSFYATIRPQANRLRSRDPAFSAQLQEPAQFDWVAVNSGDVSTSIQDNAFNFAVQSSAGGALLWQKQVLDPGRYRLSGSVADLEFQVGAAPYWTLTCEDERVLGRLSLPQSRGRTVAFAATFQVPADCPVQTLTLIGQPSDASASVAGRIVRAELVPQP
jgi:hypothetical protein